MSIRRRLLFSYAALIALVLLFLGLSGGIRFYKQRIDTDRNAMLQLKNNWSQLQISLNNMIINWQDGDSYRSFTAEYEAFDTLLLRSRSDIESRIAYPEAFKRHILNLSGVWAMARQQLDLIIEHVEQPSFASVEEAVSRGTGLQRLNHLWVEFYFSSDPGERRIAYQIETLISLVEFFPIYSDTVNHMFDVILEDAGRLQERAASLETAAIALFFLCFLVTAAALSVWFSDSLSRPIIRVSDRLNRFMGRTGSMARSEGRDEVRTLARTAEHMMRHYTKLSHRAQRLARGEVDQLELMPPVNGIVGRSMHEIAAYFQELAETSTWIRSGEYTARIRPKSEHDVLAHNINSMAEVIRRQITTLRSIFDGIDEGVLVLDEKEKILEYNRRLPRILGMPDPVEECPGCQPLTDAIPTLIGQLPSRLRGILKETLNGSPRSERYSTLEGSSGHEVPVKIIARRLDPVDSRQSNVMFLISNESWRERAKRERERLKAHATEAELRALRAQINPHFFFNTLNTIAHLVETNVDNGVVTIEKLADLFRYTLASTRKERVALREELDQVQRYLDIEKLRYGGQLRSRILAEESLETMRIPPMLLQPLVENAIRYGKDEEGNVILTIRAERENDVIRIEVMDTGVTPVDQEELVNGPGTGFKNVNHRLKTLYREQLYFRNADPHGLVVGMRIPVR